MPAQDAGNCALLLHLCAPIGPCLCTALPPHGMQDSPCTILYEQCDCSLQAKAALEEMARIYGVLSAYDAKQTIWIKVLMRDATLLSCTPEQMRNAVSFLEMLGLSPQQVFTCLKGSFLVISTLDKARFRYKHSVWGHQTPFCHGRVASL